MSYKPIVVGDETLDGMAGEWQATFDAITDGIFILDPDLIVQRANRAMAQRLGVETRDVVGRLCCEVLEGRDSPLEDCPARRAVESGTPCRVEREVASLDGTFLCSADPVVGEDGQVYRVVYTLRDISEGKRLEGEQRRQNEYLAALHETALGLIAREELGDLLQAIVERAGSVLGAAQGFVYLRHPEGACMELLVTVGNCGAERGHCVGPGEGLVGEVWASGRSLVVEEPGGMPGGGSRATCSVVGIPLLSAGEVVGVLGLGSETETFQFEEIAVLNQFGRLASIALDNAGLFDRAQAEITERKGAEEVLRQRAAQLALLNEIGSKISGVLALDSVLERAVQLVHEHFGYHHVAVFILDAEQDNLRMHARAGAFTDLFPPEHRLSKAQGLVGWVASQGQCLMVNDVEAEPRYVNFYPGVVPTRSELAVPIQVGGQVLGVLDVQSPKRDAFDENDVLVMETLADQLAVTMENARLYEAVERELVVRRRTQESLRQSEATLRSIFLAAPIGIGIVTKRVLGWTNAAFREMVGYSGEELTGQSARMVYASDEEFERVGREKYEEIGRQGTGAVETRFKHKDGHLIDVLLSSTPLEAGNLKGGVVFTALDISEQKRAERELATSQALLAAAIEQTPAGVLVADAPDGKIRIANAAALGIRGESGTLLTDIPIDLYASRWQTFYPDGRPYAAEDLPLSRAVLRGEISQDVEVIIRHASGDERWVSASAAPVRDSEGNIVAGVVVFPDITERKDAEAALREREELFRLLFEQAPIGMAITDLEGRYQRVNRAHREALGYTEEEMLARTFADVTPAEDVEINAEMRQRLLRGELPYFQLEKRFNTKGGEILHTLLQVALVRDARGRPLHFVGQIVDITDRKLAEAALHRSAARYRGFVEQSYEGIWEIDKAGGTVFANARMGQMLGYEDGRALAGRKFYEFLAPGSGGPLLPFLPGEASGEMDVQDCVLRKADGSESHAILSALSHRDDEGAFAGATLFLTDITRRKLVERALRQSEVRYRTLFEGASDAIFIHELSGSFLEANRLGCQRLGYSLEELRSLTPADIEAPEFAAQLPERMDALRRYGRHLFETVHLRRGGERIPTELSNQLIEYEGRPVVLSIARDITERKQLQLMMLRTERLAAMGHLAAALAHEINNPLQSIGSSMELALDFPLGEEERLEYLEAVREEIERLMGLTGRVLDFARPARVDRLSMSVVDAVRYALSHAGKQLQHSHIGVSVDLPEDLPEILASRDQLTQVFLNLIINASEAMPRGGRLDIRARVEGENVEIQFADSGPGIAPEALDKIFEPFHTTKDQGTGLGLAVSYSIVQQHGGTISAGNRPEGGALFTICLPLAFGEEVG